MDFGIFFPFLFRNVRWADAEKEKKEQNSRCGGREARSAPPSFQPQYKERGEKNPLVQWFTCFLLTVPTGTVTESRPHLAIRISQLFFFCNHANLTIEPWKLVLFYFRFKATGSGFALFVKNSTLRWPNTVSARSAVLCKSRRGF